MTRLRPLSDEVVTDADAEAFDAAIAAWLTAIGQDAATADEPTATYRPGHSGGRARAAT